MREPRDRELDVLIVSVILTLAFLFVGTCALAQDWRRIEGSNLVLVPIEDLRTAAGYRVAVNDKARLCAWEVAQRKKEIASLRASLNAALKSDSAATAIARMNTDALIQCWEERDKARKKARRNNPLLWAAVGALTVIVLQGITQ